MKISTKGRYALRMLLDLAAHGRENFVALKDVAERQGVSKKYLEQIIALFSGTDVLQAGRGFMGGYKLQKAPSCYTVGHILRITEGDITPVRCVAPDAPPCERSEDCITRPLWQGLDKVIRDYLDGITLQDVLDGNT